MNEILFLHMFLCLFMFMLFISYDLTGNGLGLDKDFIREKDDKEYQVFKILFCTFWELFIILYLGVITYEKVTKVKEAK